MAITPGIYRHYKGNTYRVLYTALHSETLEEMVVYQDVNSPEKVWARPAAMWNETVVADGCGADGFIIKKFSELTTVELHEILKARAQVFTKEQEILYPDADGWDDNCWHVFSRNPDGTVGAYLRLFLLDEEPGVVKMGRVLAIPKGRGIGTKLMEAATEYAAGELGADRVIVTSQKQAEGFYRKLGYETTSDTFIEAGIPHVEMLKKI